jgi:hypothetical protein
LVNAMLDSAALKDLLAKKMMMPAARPEAVAHLRSAFDMSERRLKDDRLSADDGAVLAPLGRTTVIKRPAGNTEHQTPIASG